MIFINNILWALLAFLAGSIPSAYLVAKYVKGIDIREHGSGNVGATNVFRVVGKKWGVVVFLLDALKGWIAAVIIATSPDAFVNLTYPLKQLLFGGAAICGHTFTPWLKFKGGKGVATAAGALLGIFPFATLIAILIWAIAFAISRYVSIASMISAALFPVLLVIFHRSTESFELVFSVCVILAGLLIYNHRSNIRRLFEGREARARFTNQKTK